MRIISKDQFTGRKNALMNHDEICQEKLCSVCEYFKKVAKFRFDAGNFARYVQHSLTPQPSSKHEKTKKKVHFPAETLFCSSSEFTGLPLDIHLLHNACIFNTSFKEVRLLSRDQSF